MWLSFITDEQLKRHIKEVVLNTYIQSFDTIDLRKFNNNIIDPIKLTFDSKVYKRSVEDIISNEIERQEDKRNNNSIGYFHQNIFKYIKGCEVPKSGFDVIFTDNNNVKHCVEIKNKHNTMNYSSRTKTYMRFQNHLKNNPNDLCYLVEVISKRSQNIPWSLDIDGQKFVNEKIRKISIDNFYEIVTGDRLAFYKLCKVLPIVLDKVLEEFKIVKNRYDSVINELKKMNNDVLKSLYRLAFKSYKGFDNY